MRFVIGIGNPGKEYIGTRHKIGFTVIESLAESLSANFKKSGCMQLAKAGINEEEVFLIKPLTYVNKSGNIIAPLLKAWGYAGSADGSFESSIMVVCDDINLPLGKIRIRKKGSSGGHNGMKSLIDAVGSGDFPRLRIGVGATEGVDARDYVLGNFRKSEKQIIKEVVKNAKDAVESWISEGIDNCMNKFNKES